MNRREFLSGVGLMFGGMLLPDGLFAEATASAVPNLVFGVISDTHLRRSRPKEKPAPSFPTKYYQKALEYFREQGVDAVMHCGDFAHRGLVCEMKFHADIWYKVFPDDKGKDGRPVAKLFVTGNHDWVGSTYQDDFGSAMYPDPEVRRKKVLANVMAEQWKRLWHEPYERVWHKCVKGYHFFGEHYEGSYDELGPRVVAESETCMLKGIRPFFVLKHTPPEADLIKRLRAYPNAVTFFGHQHQSLTSDYAIRFDGHPMIQCASLRNSGPEPVPGFEISEKPEKSDQTRQGMLVKVYDDRLVIARRDFYNGGSLGPDWVMPFGKYDPHPFAREELAKLRGAPEFASDARLAVTRTDKDLKVRIPPTRAKAHVRAYAYDVTVSDGEGRTKGRTCVYAAGCDLGPGNKQAQLPTEVNVPVKDLAKCASLQVSVRPVSSLGVAGRAVTAVVPANQP